MIKLEAIDNYTAFMVQKVTSFGNTDFAALRKDKKTKKWFLDLYSGKTISIEDLADLVRIANKLDDE